MEESCLEFLSDEKVWKPLIDGMYLESRDLARLFLCTSRRFSEAVVTSVCTESLNDLRQSSPIWKHPVLWKLLCDEHWGKKNADNLVRNCRLGAETCFRNFILPSPPTTQGNVVPLKLQPKDYLIVVEVRDSETFHLICHECIPGSMMTDFF